MMTLRQGTAALEGWLARVEADDQPELSLTRRRHPPRPGRRHRRAVPPLQLRRHGGQLNKIKMIKRQMYGRASFPLLHKRVILHPE
jgi:hypothetical protein